MNLELLADPTILDIGCNDGSEVDWFNKIFESPAIYCFEVDPRPIKRFKEKFGQTQNPNIYLFEMALSDRTGEIEFYQSSGYLNEKDKELNPSGWDYSGSIRRPKGHIDAIPSITFNQSIIVKTSTLDDWCKENEIEIIDFIWMDVQGAELDVCRGAKNALSKTRYIYTEYNNFEQYEGQASLTQLLKYLKNFEILIRYKNDVLLKQYLCQFSPESREDFNGKLSFKRGLAEVVILKNSVKVFRKSFLMYSLYYKGLRLGVTF